MAVLTPTKGIPIAGLASSAAAHAVESYENKAAQAIEKNLIPETVTKAVSQKGIVNNTTTQQFKGASDPLGKGLGVAYQVQQASFMSGMAAMLVGGIGTFTGIKAIKKFARTMNIGAHMQDYTIGDVVGAGAKVANKVPQPVMARMGQAVQSASDFAAPVTGAFNDAANKAGGIKLGFLDRWARNRGMANAMQSNQLHKGLQEEIVNYTHNIGKMQGVDAATRSGLLDRAKEIQTSLTSGYEHATNRDVYQGVRSNLRALESDLHKIADQAQGPGYKNMGSGIANGARSAGDKIGGLFGKGGFFKKSPKVEAIRTDVKMDAKVLADQARGLRAATTAMAEKAEGAAGDLTAKGWLGLRGKVLPNITLQEGMTGAIQTGAFVMASKKAYSQGKDAIGKLKQQYQDITGQEISTRKLLFSGDLPETVKDSRIRALGNTLPSIFGNFALFATTLIFQRNMKLWQILGLQVGGGMLMNGVLKEDYATNLYDGLKAKHAAGENISAQEYIDVLASMDKKTAAKGTMHGGTVPVSDVAYYLAFNQTDPAEVIQMIEASHKNPLAAEAWAKSAQQAIAAHHAEAEKAKAPAAPAVEPVQDQTAALPDPKAGILLPDRAVLGAHTAKAVAEQHTRLARGPGVMTPA